MNDLSSAIEAILFAAGEAVPAARISLILGVNESEVMECASSLQQEYVKSNRGIRILRLDDKLQMCSAPEYSAYIGKILEQRKPPMLSQAALETLAIVAYFQPVTRAYVEQLRGVDSSYTVSVLCERGLIEECGRLDVPGRPAVFRTTDVFLRTMGVSSLEELPELPELGENEGMEKLKNAIELLQNPISGDQISLGELSSNEE